MLHQPAPQDPHDTPWLGHSHHHPCRHRTARLPPKVRKSSELVTVRKAGWVFRPIQDSGGELEGIAGSYSREQYTDALFVFDRTNVSAARVLDDAYGGGCVWSTEGSDLQEVVRELLGLPKPGEPQCH
jgi:hypothetical protein